MNDGQRLLDQLSQEMQQGRPIEEIEKGWTTFKLIRSHCDLHRSEDKPVMDAVKQLERGLSIFTSDVRAGVPSPYMGHGVAISSLRGLLENDVDVDGWPKSGRRSAPIRKGRLK